MELIEFLNRIHMVQPAVELLKQLAASKRIKEEQYLQDKMLYKRNRQQFYEKVSSIRTIGCGFCMISAAWE